MITFGLKCVETGIGSFESKIRHGVYQGYSYAGMIHNTDFKKNYWSQWISNPLLCQSGWHCVLRNQIIRTERFWSSKLSDFENVNDPSSYLVQGNEIWVVAVRGENEIDTVKATYSQIRFVKVIAKTTATTFEYSHAKWLAHPEKLVALLDKTVAAIKSNPKKYGFEKEDEFV